MASAIDKSQMILADGIKPGPNNTPAVYFDGGDCAVDANLQHKGSKVGFYGVAATERASAYTQTYSTSDKTHANPTATAVATTAATATSPYGYTTAAQADAIVAAINALITDLADVKQLVNAVIDDLQSLGLVQ